MKTQRTHRDKVLNKLELTKQVSYDAGPIKPNAHQISVDSCYNKRTPSTLLENSVLIRSLNDISMSLDDLGVVNSDPTASYFQNIRVSSEYHLKKSSKSKQPVIGH